MGKWVFLVILVAACLLDQWVTEARSRRSRHRGGGRGNSSSWHGWRRMRLCFPDNTTKAHCFSKFPNAGHHPKHWLNWFMPQVAEDSYVINTTWSLDTEDFVVTKIEQNPKYLCQYKDQFVWAMTCLRNYTKTKCPWLPDRMTGKYDKFAKGMDYICSRIEEMDAMCLNVHWSSMGKCKGQAYSKISEDFDHLGRRGHGHSRRSDYGNKNYTRDDDSTNSTSSGGRGRWSRPKGNSTGGDKSGSGGRGGGWWRRHQRSRNDSDNSTRGGNSMRSQMYCRFHYVMLHCVRDSVASCHGRTAEIMFDFMRNMSEPSCQDKMEEWDEAQVLKQVMDCQGDQCDSAPHLKPRLLWLALLLALGLMMTHKF